MNIKLLFTTVVVLAVHITPLAEGQSAANMYYIAFKVQVSEVFSQLFSKSGQYGQPGNPIFESKLTSIVNGMARCHVEGMKNFDDIHVQKAYNAVANGGTYADAKMAFENSLAFSAADSEESRKIVARALTRSAEQGKRCVSAVMQ